MRPPKKWLCGLMLAAVMAVPVIIFAQTTATTNAKSNPSASTANASNPVAPNPTAVLGNANLTALLNVLVTKGVIASAEANAIRNAAPETEFQLLVDVLVRKGIVSAEDLPAIAAVKPNAQPAVDAYPATAGPAVSVLAASAPVTSTNATQAMQPAAPASKEKKPEGPTVVAAVAPLRVLPLDPPVKDGLVPSFKAGAVKITPYGFIKATAVYDSSAPNGDDFPFLGIFLNSSTPYSTGPSKDPSFHLKARASRFGASFEWPDISKRLTLTGKVEGDFEGNFSASDSGGISSIRNPAPRLRLAYARVDYAASEKSDIFFEAGQDWTLFGSSVLPNLLETTFLGAYSGNVWERAPQMRFGLVQKLGGERNFKFSPEFAIMMPSTGQIYKLNGTLGGFAAQIGEAERQGADSGRPELEARAVLQFQLDKAPGVAPAQLIWSGYEARRTSITTSSNFTSAQTAALSGTSFQNGFTASSNLYGNQIAVQLPTRWFTLVASAFRGGDMRFMMAGQLNSNYTDVTGLYQVQSFATVDGVAGKVSGASMLGCTVNAAIGSACTTAGGTTVVAREHPVGAFGGFVNLGLPLSRWFNANPKGRNAGWQLYLHAGKDQVVHRDLARANGFGCSSADAVNPTVCNGGIPLLQSRLLAATVYYKLNPWITFGFEQSQYQTTLLPDAVKAGTTYKIAGQPADKWKDQRTEFGPIFTF